MRLPGEHMKTRISLSIAIFLSCVAPSFSQTKFLDKFPMPDIGGAAVEKTVKAASDKMLDISKQFSKMKPMLETLGFHIANVQFEMLPPSGQWCVVSKSNDGVFEIEGIEKEDAIVRSVIYAASSAKKVQDVLGFPIIVMNVDLSTSPNISLSYYSNDEADIISGGRTKFLETLCTFSLLKSNSRN